MKDNKAVRIILLLLLVIWMSVIFVMSAQPADKSSQVSGGFVSKIIGVIFRDFENFSDEIQAKLTNTITFIVRKAAHFLEFGVLGTLTAITTFTFKNANLYLKTFVSAVFCLLYAISDEVHQYFVPGRSGQVSDVALDTFGALCGAVFAVIIIVLLKKYKEKHTT